MVIAMCRRWCAVTCLSSAAVGSPVLASPVCEAQLSSAQRHRFTLAVQACPTRPAPATPAQAGTEHHADALVATDVPVPRQAEVVPPPESAHLQLFARGGVVAAELPRPAHGRLMPQQPRVHRPAAAPSPSASRGSASPASLKQPLRAVSLAPSIDAVARKHDIDPLLLHAIAHVESRHDPAARSHAGALGVMQVMPATARRFGVAEKHALHVADTNLEVSAAYLKTLQQRFGLDLPLVLAAYNAGEGAVERHGRRIPPYAETRDYVQRVLQQYGVLQRYRGLGAGAAGPPAAVSAAL